MNFELLRLVGVRPVGIMMGDVVMNAPRPLLGTPIEDVTTTAPDLMGFTVVVMGHTYRREDVIDGNKRLDARVIAWITEADAIREERARLEALYGMDVHNVYTTDADWLISWRNHEAQHRGTIYISHEAPDAPIDPVHTFEAGGEA